ncbi:vitelline membrane outer layer protein 1-like [Panulirus ornatus]|uniref:vitelline membrane outer layer protein 1-like n=1 Tax=Panulirus ornatus TaxID=150431 RepID=UPI003A884A3A
MVIHRYFLLCLVGVSCGWWGCQASSVDFERIMVDNGIYWRGEYGSDDLCSLSTNVSYASAMDFKFEPLTHMDNTGGNSVKLFCKDLGNHITKYITSIEGQAGTWQGVRSCPSSDFIVGFRLRVFPDQGAWGDDFAVDNIQVECSDGTVLDGLNGVLPTRRHRQEQDGEEVSRERVELDGERTVEVVRSSRGHREAKLNGNWGSWAECSAGKRVIGIQTIVEEHHPFEDDAGLCDVTMLCM